MRGHRQNEVGRIQHTPSGADLRRAATGSGGVASMNERTPPKSARSLLWMPKLSFSIQAKDVNQRGYAVIIGSC